MVKNIDSIVLWKGDKNYNDLPIVRVNFKFPCEYTCFSIEDLLSILRLWIRGEEMKYPQSEGFKGRELLLIEILKVFSEGVKK